MASVAFTQGYQAYCNDDPPVPPPGLSHAQRHAWSEGWWEAHDDDSIWGTW